MPQPATSHVTEDEFFDFIQSRDEKWELVDGEPMMMAGTNQRRQSIAANILASLHTPVIHYILIVDADNACSLLHCRDRDGWSEVMYDGLDEVINFREIDAALALADIYFGLDLRPKLVRDTVCSKCGVSPARAGMAA